MKGKSVLIFCLCTCLLTGMVYADETSQTPVAGTGYGFISVTSYPAGGAIYLDGVYEKLTPSGIDHVMPGFHTVEVRLSGYEDFSYRAEVSNGTREDIAVTLDLATTQNATSAVPGFGSIAVDSNPGGALVTLDGTAAGKTPAGRAALILNSIPTGTHTITVELTGYPPYTTSITVI